MFSKTFIARQPILNVFNKTVAYELLFRNSDKNIYPVEIDGKSATQGIIYNSILGQGLKTISGDKKVFINIDENSLFDDILFKLPKNVVYLEILESIPASTKNIERIKHLKQHGFKIILDDFVLNSDSKKLIPHCHIIKIDIRATPLTSIKNDLIFYRENKIRLLAEKVETLNEYNDCVNAGFKFFQGYYFFEPEILSSRKTNPTNCIVMMAYKKIITEKGFDSISETIKTDLGLSEKIIRHANHYLSENGSQKIFSVRQAIGFIGMDNLQRLLGFLLKESSENPITHEIIEVSTIRSLFMSKLLSRKGKKTKEMGCLTGFFFNIDTLTHLTKTKALESLNLRMEINEAILFKKGIIGDALSLSLAIESDQIKEVNKFSAKLELSPNTSNEIYLESINEINNLKRL